MSDARILRATPLIAHRRIAAPGSPGIFDVPPPNAPPPKAGRVLAGAATIPLGGEPDVAGLVMPDAAPLDAALPAAPVLLGI